MLLSKLSQWVANVFLPWLWGATRRVWRAAKDLVAYFDGTLDQDAALRIKTLYRLPDRSGLTAEGKQANAEQALAAFHGVPLVVARRLTQAAHNYLRAKQYLSDAGA